MTALIRVLFIIVIVLERAIFCLQGFVDNDANFRRACVGVIVVLDLER